MEQDNARTSRALMVIDDAHPAISWIPGST